MRRPRRTVARLVTLSSDVGAAYAAQMKAVLVRRLDAGSVVDLAHDLRPHAIGEAGFVVRAMAQGFPPGTVHVVIVDPGVGGTRDPVVVACRDGSALVGPNNGVLAPLARALGGGSAYRLEARGAAGRVGTTFDGRDLFAPAAARLALGTPARRLGRPVRLIGSPVPEPERFPGGARGTAVHIDRFGNIITDVPSAWAPREVRATEVRLGSHVRRLPLVPSYERAGRGALAVLRSSFGTLEIAVAEGNAASRTGTIGGDRVTFRWCPRRNGK